MSDQVKPANASNPRTGPATAGRMRASENRLAVKMERRGWLCIVPELAPRARVVLLKHIPELRGGDGKGA